MVSQIGYFHTQIWPKFWWLDTEGNHDSTQCFWLAIYPQKIGELWTTPYTVLMHQDWITIYSREENQSPQEEKSNSVDENQQQIQPTYNARSKIQTWATLVWLEARLYSALTTEQFLLPKNVGTVIHMNWWRKRTELPVTGNSFSFKGCNILSCLLIVLRK